MFAGWRRKSKGPQSNHAIVSSGLSPKKTREGSPQSSPSFNKKKQMEEGVSPRLDLDLSLEMKEEYERKIRVLSTCLEEKAEENITLHEKIQSQERRISNLSKELESAKDLEIFISELNALLCEKDEQFAALSEDSKAKNKERLELKELNGEFERRIRVLSTCLEEMAQENLGYWTTGGKVNQVENGELDEIIEEKEDLHSSSGSVNTVEAKLIEVTMKQDLIRSEENMKSLQRQLEEVQEDLVEAEEKLQFKEKRIVQLNAKLIDAVNKKNSYLESNELYEAKLKDLEKELMENLNQEGIRRQEAEYIASKLKKKVAELQFLLDECEQDSDSSYYSEDDDFD